MVSDLNKILAISCGFAELRPEPFFGLTFQFHQFKFARSTILPQIGGSGDPGDGPTDRVPAKKVTTVYPGTRVP